MVKVHIATPAYSGQVTAGYALSLADTCVLFKENNMEYVHAISSSGSLLVLERNFLIQKFLETDATHIMCIDADIQWNPQTVINFVNADLPIIAALYPEKQSGNFMHRRYLDENGNMLKTPSGLLKMAGIPAGFMLIKREVLEKIRQDLPQYEYTGWIDEKTSFKSYAWFNTEIVDGLFWGEDYVFSQRCIDAGFGIWIDPTVALVHGSRCDSFQGWIERNGFDKKEPVIDSEVSAV
jgi:hypothetical protein